MASAGDRFEMPDGSVYAVLAPAAASGGERVEMEFVLPDRCVSPPLHVHDHQVEGYEVLEGSFEVTVGERRLRLGPGEVAEVLIGVPHTFRNHSGTIARVRNWHAPAMRFEDFIAETHAALRAAGVTHKRDPRVLMLLAKVMLDYPETLRPARARERIPMRAMASLARLLPARG